MSDKIFAKGIIYKEPSDKAPDFVVGAISVKKSEFIPFLDSQTGDWVNLKINIGKNGKPYIELDTWKPNRQRTSKEDEEFDRQFDAMPDIDEMSNSDLPF